MNTSICDILMVAPVVAIMALVYVDVWYLMFEGIQERYKLQAWVMGTLGVAFTSLLVGVVLKVLGACG